MEPDQEQTAPEADDNTSGSPAQTVRVPNVSPGAKSGLDHTVIGADALAPPQDDDDEGDASEPDLDLPDTQDAAAAWVNAAEDSETAKDRADLVWAKYGDGNDAGDLATALRTAVYGDPGPVAKAEVPATTAEAPAGDVVEVPDDLDPEAFDAWVSGDAVEGDETDNPERWAAYQGRLAAARLVDPTYHQSAVDPDATDADED